MPRDPRGSARSPGQASGVRSARSQRQLDHHITAKSSGEPRLNAATPSPARAGETTAGLVCGARAEPNTGSCPTCTLISGLHPRGFTSSVGACRVPAGVRSPDNCCMALAEWRFPHGALLQPWPRIGKVCPCPGTGHDGDTNPATTSSSPLLPQVMGGKAKGAVVNTALS